MPLDDTILFCLEWLFLITLIEFLIFVVILCYNGK